LACHYDSKATPYGFLGATDSAVPCAMMLHLAATLDKSLKAHKEETRDTTLQLIFFDGEEAFQQWTSTDSIYGSRHLAHLWNKRKFPSNQLERKKCAHIDDMASELDRMDVMVLLDLLGGPNPTFYNYFTNTYPLFMRLYKIGEN
jgi:glutaminyl-peptide cyclotransferase